MTHEIPQAEQDAFSQGVICAVRSGEYLCLEPPDKVFAIVMVGMDCRAYNIRIELPENHGLEDYAGVKISKTQIKDPEDPDKMLDQYTLTPKHDWQKPFEITAIGVNLEEEWNRLHGVHND